MMLECQKNYLRGICVLWILLLHIVHVDASIFIADTDTISTDEESNVSNKTLNNREDENKMKRWGASQKSLNDSLNDSVAKMIHESNANGTISHPPPDFFKLSGRIATSQSTMNSYFEDENIPTIPFLECNDVGTTTPPIETLSASFRTFPKSAHPTSFSNSRGFIVPLTKLEIQTSDGESTRIFDKGEVVWVDGDYRLSSAGDDDMNALIVEVPTGMQIGMKRDFFGLQTKRLTCNDIENNTLVKRFPAKKLLLTMTGLTLSSLMTYFWIKVAPLQLAVGFGGACLIAGGTMGVVMCGERLCDTIESVLKNRGIDQDLGFEDYEKDEQDETILDTTNTAITI
jgi:hypothetical protein